MKRRRFLDWLLVGGAIAGLTLGVSAARDFGDHVDDVSAATNTVPPGGSSSTTEETSSNPDTTSETPVSDDGSTTEPQATEAQSASVAPQVAEAAVVSPAAVNQPTLTDGWQCVNGEGWISQGQTVKLWDYKTDQFTFEDFADFPLQVNGLGYNPVDGLLYAMDVNNNIVVMDKNGTTENLGIPENPDGSKLPDVAVAFNLGTFGPDGTYYVAETRNVGKIWAIDLSDGTFDIINVTIDGEIADIGAADFAYDPRTGKLATIQTNSSRVIQIDPATGEATVFEMPIDDNVVLTAIGNGGANIDPSGVLYVLNNGNAANGGALYVANPPFESTTLTQKPENGPASANNDAAGCTFGIKLTKTVDPVRIPEGDRVTYEFILDYETQTATTTGKMTDTLDYGGLWVEGTLTVDGVATDTPLGGTVTYDGSTITLDGMDIEGDSRHVFTVDVDVPVGTVPDNLKETTVFNQSQLTGMPAVIPAVTLSDFPDTTAIDDKTPLEVYVTPTIGVAKDVGTPVDNGDDTFNVPYDLVVENTGRITLNDLTLVDDIATQFGSAFIEVVGDPVVTPDPVSPPTAAPLANAAYDAKTNLDMIDGSNATLEPGQRYKVSIVVKIDPDESKTTLENQATATGEDETGALATDLSDNGTDPDGDNGEGGTDDPTPTDIPNIQIEKTVVGTPVDASSGTENNYDVTYQFVATNIGNTPLTKITMTDDWSTQLGSAFVRVVSAPVITATDATTSPTVGSGNPDLLSGNDGQLDPDQSVTVQVVVEVDASEAAAPTVNTASIGGTAPDGGTVIDEDDAQVALPDISVTKTVGDTAAAASGVVGNYDVPFTFVVENVGNQTLTDVSLIDDLATQFGDGFVGVSVAPAVDGIVGANADFDGSSETDLLDGTGSFAPDAKFTVTVTVEMKAAALATNENKATVSGTDPSDLVVTDESVAELKLSGISLVKTVGQAYPANSGVLGNFDVPFTFVVENTGNQTLTKLSLLDDMANQFGDGFVDVIVAPAVDSITGPNADFDADGDTEMLDGTGSFKPGEKFTVTVTVEIDPSAGPIPLTNTATVTGETPDGGELKDISQVPVPLPHIAVVKSAGNPLPAASGKPGNYDIPYTFIVKNTGNETLTDLSLIEDFATQYGDAFIGVTVAPVVDEIAAGNSSFDGKTDKDLLDGTGTFEPGADFIVTVTAEVNEPAAPDVLDNQGLASGTDSNNTTVDDLSDSGTDPDSTNPGEPGDTGGPDDPTPVTLPSRDPKIGIAKKVTDIVLNEDNDNAEVTFTLVVQNIGNVDLVSLSVDDDIKTQFGPAFVSAGSAASPDFDVNTSFDGATDTELLADGNALAVGEKGTITFKVVIDPTAEGQDDPLLNQANVTGVDPARPDEKVEDKSDSGLDPNGNNPGEPGDTGGPDDPTPVSVGSFDLEKKLLGSTKGADGQTTVQFEIVVTNTSSTTVTDVEVYDDVLVQFASANPDKTSLQAADKTGKANPSWDGTAQSNVFAPGQSIKPGASLSVTVTLKVKPTVTTDLTNVATATVKGPDGKPLPEKKDDAKVQVTPPSVIQPPPTGSNVLTAMFAAALLLVAGSCLVTVSRRRRLAF